jgi:hypothetical protein
MFQKKSCKKIKTNILCSITSVRKSNRSRDHIEKYGRARQAIDDNIIWLMRFACWITKAIVTHSEYVILNPLNTELNSICHLLALLEAHHILRVSRIRVNAFPWQQWLRKRASMIYHSTLPIMFFYWNLFALFDTNHIVHEVCPRVVASW